MSSSANRTRPAVPKSRAPRPVAGAGVVRHGDEAVGEARVVEVGGECVVVVEQLPDQQGEHDPRLVDADGQRHAVHRSPGRWRIALQRLVCGDRGQDRAALLHVKTELAPGPRARWVKPPLQQRSGGGRDALRHGWVHVVLLARVVLGDRFNQQVNSAYNTTLIENATEN